MSSNGNRTHNLHLQPDVLRLHYDNLNLHMVIEMWDENKIKSVPNLFSQHYTADIGKRQKCIRN